MSAVITSAWARVRSLLPRRQDLDAVKRDPKRDLLAGITVAVVALPLALAFGVASGLGAEAGLVTAILAGAVAAVFGGSNLQVSGPTGAMAVVLIPVVHQFGVGGVLLAGFLAGLVLIGMATAGLGKYVKYLPLPVVEGFTAGIAAVIVLQQVPAALGVEPGDAERVWQVAGEAVATFAKAPDLAPPVVAIAVALLMLFGARWRPGVPFSLVGVLAATALASADVFGLGGLDRIGSLPAGLPGPSFSFLSLGDVTSLLPAVLALASLAALESLLSATVADGMSVNQRHDPDRELFGQGLANMVVPVFGGMPATAAIARTAVNVKAGAASRLAAFTHSAALLVMVLVGTGLVSEIPLAALAGVLFATAVRMVEVGSLFAVSRATRGDAAVLLLTFLITIIFDLVAAVVVGLALAIVLALRAVARTASMDAIELERGDHSSEEHELLEEHIVAYRLDGPLFFAAAHRFLLELSEIADVRVVVLRMSRVTTIDATGGRVLGDAIKRLEARGIILLLSGLSEDHGNIISTVEAVNRLGEKGLIFDETPDAIAFARRLVFTEKDLP